MVTMRLGFAPEGPSDAVLLDLTQNRVLFALEQSLRVSSSYDG